MFNNENGASKRLSSLVTVLLQHSYQEIATLLSRYYSTPVKILQHSCQEITRLISRDRSTPIKRLQDCYQEITALLSTDHKTPVKKSQHSCQEIAAKHNKMIEYVNFFLLCVWVKRCIAFLKMAEENVRTLYFGTMMPQSQRRKDKSFSNVFSLAIASYIWVRSTPKNKLTNLAMKKWINFLIITKLNSQVRW